MNSVIASVHGNLCGDGCISVFKENRGLRDIKRYNRKNHHRIRHVIAYTNYRLELLNKFKRNLRFIFPKIKFTADRWCEVRIRDPNAVKFFLRFNNYGSRKWSLPDDIFYRSRKIKVAWLRSFYDDEGSFAGKRVIVETINRKGMEQVSLILESLNIENKLRHYNRISRITVYDTRKYADLIGFDHRLKSTKLKKIIDKIN